MTNAQGKRICGSKRARGGICQSPVLYSNGRCKKHGGPSPMGPANGAYTNGRRSKLRQALPPSMRAAYDEVVNDPTRVEMTEHLGILHSMLVDSVRRWDDGAGLLFSKLRTAWDAASAEQFKGDSVDRAALARHERTIRDLIERGVADEEARKETLRIIQDIRRVSESERKRMIEVEQVMTNDQVAMLVSDIVHDVLAEVHDPQILGRIHRRFAARLNAYNEAKGISA